MLAAEKTEKSDEAELCPRLRAARIQIGFERHTYLIRGGEVEGRADKGKGRRGTTEEAGEEKR
jgi:hypothetical protein